ncbi:MAG: hypothetical protein KDE55_20860 [Novosphingobium sp.]|nr:hypothetical protein [Novosphingobium sp.]
MAGRTKTLALAAMVAVMPMLGACQQEAGEAQAGDVVKAPADATDLVDVNAHMQMSASEALQEAMKDTFEPGQVTLLEAVAHQMAIANNCAGFDLDTGKAQAEMAKIGKGKPGSTDAPDVLKQKTSMALGMALGSQLTIAASDPAAFCSHAEEEKPKEGETADGYILTSPA